MSTPETHLGAYYEMDFLSSGTNSNSRESNSYTPRSRQLYATLDKDNWGLHVLAGRAWSLMTTNTKGIMPRQEQIPLTIDAQYVEGFNWLRVPQFRVVEDFGHGLWAGVSAESPQVVTSPITARPAGTITNPGNSAGLLNNSTTYSNDYLPDFDGKVALDPGWGHYELKTLSADVHRAGGGANRNATGYGVGGAAAMPIVPAYVDLQLSGLYGYGIGRYGSGQLPDAAFKADNSTWRRFPRRRGWWALSVTRGPVTISTCMAGGSTPTAPGHRHTGDLRLRFAGASGYGSPNLNVSGCNH